MGLTLAVTLIATAACGSNASGTHGAGGGKTAEIGFVYTRVSSTDFTPSVGGLQAAFKSFNDAGGVDGRTLQVVACNDNGTPDGATTCAQQMISNPNIIAVEANTFEGAVYARSFAMAKLAYMPLIPITPDDSSHATLALSGGSGAYAPAGLSYLIKNLGAKKVSVFGSVTTSVDLMHAYSQPVVDKLGAQLVGGDLLLTAGQSDFLPLIARAQSAGAQGAYIGFLAPGDYVPFLQAYQAAGATFPLVGAVASMTPQTIDAFAQAKVNLIAVSSFGPADSNGAANKKYQEVSKAAGQPVSEFGQFGYAGGLALKALLVEVGADVNRASVYNAASAKEIDLNATSLFPGRIDRPLPDSPQWEGVGNFGAYLGEYVDGKYKALSNTPSDSSVYFQ